MGHIQYESDSSVSVENLRIIVLDILNSVYTMNIRKKLLLKLTDKGNSLPIEIRHNEMRQLESLGIFQDFSQVKLSPRVKRLIKTTLPLYL